MSASQDKTTPTSPCSRKSGGSRVRACIFLNSTSCLALPYLAVASQDGEHNSSNHNSAEAFGLCSRLSIRPSLRTRAHARTRLARRATQPSAAQLAAPYLSYVATARISCIILSLHCITDLHHVHRRLLLRLATLRRLYSVPKRFICAASSAPPTALPCPAML